MNLSCTRWWAPLAFHRILDSGPSFCIGRRIPLILKRLTSQSPISYSRTGGVLGRGGICGRRLSFTLTFSTICTPFISIYPTTKHWYPTCGKKESTFRLLLGEIFAWQERMMWPWSFQVDCTSMGLTGDGWRRMQPLEAPCLDIICSSSRKLVVMIVVRPASSTQQQAA